MYMLRSKLEIWVLREILEFIWAKLVKCVYFEFGPVMSLSAQLCLGNSGSAPGKLAKARKFEKLSFGIRFV